MFIVAAPRSAAALLIDEQAAHLKLRFEPSDARLCIVLPANLTVDAMCEDLDIPGMRSDLAKLEGLTHVLAVRRGESSYMILKLTQTPGLDDPTAQTMAAWAHGFLEAAQRTAGAVHTVHPKRPAPHAEMLHFGPASVMRIEVSLDAKPGSDVPSMANASYAIAGDGATHLLTILATPDVVEQAKRDVETALAAIKVDPATSHEYKVGYLIGKVIGAVVTLAAFVGVGVIAVWFAVRKKRKAA
jgi:hypothetical protein